MKLCRVAAVAASVVIVLLWAGCGDVFRPVANPIISPGGDPQNFHLATVVSHGVPMPDGLCFDGSAPPCPGAVTQIDVPGDVALTTVKVGRTPTFATFAAGLALTYVANRDSDSLSSFTNVLLTSQTTTTPTVTTTALSGGAGPVFILPVTVNPPTIATSTPFLYVANPGNNTVSVVNDNSNALVAQVAVGPSPVALAAPPNGNKVYAVNHGSNTVSVISTADNTVTSTITVGSGPAWAVANPNGNAVYVVNQGSASVSIIDPTTDAVTGTLALPASGGSNFILFDSKLLRLYVTNPNANSVTVFDVSGAAPQKMADVAVGPGPTAVAVGANGAKAYVADAGATTGCSGEANMGRVTVINTSNNQAVNCISVGKSPSWIAASTDGAKVYVPHRERTLATSNGTTTVAVAAGTSIINTATDQVITNVPAPFADPSCTAEDVNTPPTTNCIRMVPVYATASQ